MNRFTLPSAPLAGALALALAIGAPHARAQQPTPQPAPSPFPSQPQPQPQPQPPAGQPLPPPQPPGAFPQQPPPQGYPPPQQGYPPPQGYPPAQQGYPPPQGYPPQQGYPPPQQGYPPYGQYTPPPYPPYGQPTSPPVPSDKRGPEEMLFLYGTSIAYGVGSGIWLDALGHVSDPGVAFIAPLALGAAAPIGVYFWDDYAALHRGVPASIATGLTLGAVEGMAISGVQWQHTANGGPDTWSFATQTTMTWVMATGGGVGGWAFGEWLRPDPRSLGFIASGAGWGAISGTLLGLGVSGDRAGDAASVVGLIGYNAGILATGALSINYVPSWRTQKYMWLGFLGGTAAASIVYLFYIGNSADPKHGLIANGLGGLAGVGIAGALTANMKDDDDAKNATWKPPFNLGFAPSPHGGFTMNASGTW